MNTYALRIRAAHRAAAYVIGALSLIYVMILSCSVKAYATDSMTQVTIEYYTGHPSTIVPYRDAYVAADAGVGATKYTTKSTGKIVWGEPDAQGNYSMYFDAKDIHFLAAHINTSEAAFNTNFSSYLATYEQIEKIKATKTEIENRLASVKTKAETAKEAVK